MRKQNFTIIYWNLWFEMQDGSRGDGSLLNQKLDEFIKKYSPDAFGLNEAYAHAQTGKSPVLDHLRKNGYHIHFCEFGHKADGWAVGSAIATKRKLKRVVSHSYGDDTHSKRRRFINHKSQLIEARLDFGGTEITILVNHLCSPHVVDWRTHSRQRKGYRKVITGINSRNLIIGGDYNEPKFMLSWPKTPKIFTRKTGSLRRPTWRLNGKKRYLLLANLDNLFYKTGGNLQLINFELLDRWPSDHSPLLAEFEIKK